MTTYHYTDQLGHAVTGARKAAAEALEQLTALDEELAAERESHRAEKLRLVERAEAAELDAQEQTTAREVALARVAELEAQIEAVGKVATGYQERAHAAEQRVTSLESQVVGYQQSLGESRERVAELERKLDKANMVVLELRSERVEHRDARRDAEDRADDAERAQRLAESRLEDETAAAFQRGVQEGQESARA